MLHVCYPGGTRIILYIVSMKKPIGYCIQCSNPIYVGRSIKKFCNPECKDKYNNAIKIKEQQEIKKVDTVLRRNRRVLKKLFDPKKSDKIVRREEMIREGFEFGFLTHVVVTKGKLNEITFCYDYGYREVANERYQLFTSYSKVQVKDGYIVKIN